MREELKPCPFCGSEARFEVDGERGWICCSNEDCTAWDTEIFSTTDEAIKAWNTRAEKTCHNKSKFSDCFECSECDFYTEDAAGLLIGELFKRCPVCEAKVINNGA